MNRISAEKFWIIFAKALKDKLKKHDRNKLYGSNKKWTKFVINLLEEIGYTEFKCESVVPEYFRKIDVCYFDKSGKDDWTKWAMEVAIEHENDGKTWMNECNKLMLISCGLKVVFLEYKKSKKEIIKIKADFKEKYKSRKYHIEDEAWLFVFFPNMMIWGDNDYLAYEFKNNKFNDLKEIKILNP